MLAGVDRSNNKLRQISSGRIFAILLNYLNSCGFRIWSRGGPINFFRDFADIAKLGEPSKVYNIGQGPGPALGPWKLLHFWLSNMHSPTFPGTFSSIFLVHICVGKLQNIYFNMKDSGHFDKCNFHFLYLKKSSVYLFIWFSFQIYYSVSRGSGACLGPQKLLHF